MKANLKSSIEIEEENRNCYHITCEMRVINPRDKTHPIVRKMMKVFRPIDYKRYFMCSAADQIEFLKTMNIENCELVHDPSLEKIEKIKFPPTAEEENLRRRAVRSMNKMSKK